MGRRLPEVNKSISVIRLTGELEIGRKDEITNALTLSGSESGILLDFSDVTYADSTSLAELLRFRDESSQANIPVAIVIGSRQFARLIQYAGLGHAFRIFDNRAAALSDLSQATAT
jgi:anti-anti-sigma factor